MTAETQVEISTPRLNDVVVNWLTLLITSFIAILSIYGFLSMIFIPTPITMARRRTKFGKRFSTSDFSDLDEVNMINFSFLLLTPERSRSSIKESFYISPSYFSSFWKIELIVQKAVKNLFEILSGKLRTVSSHKHAFYFRLLLGLRK